MFAGIAGALLVFSGIWHATEWMMDGRRRDTWRLVPVGMVYLILGCLVVGQVGGVVVMIIALILATLGGGFAFVNRARLDVRGWVIWVFVIIDVIVVVCLLAALLGG